MFDRVGGVALRGQALGGCVAWEVRVGSQGPGGGGNGLRDQFLLFFLIFLKFLFFSFCLSSFPCLFIFELFLPHLAACGILVPPPPALEGRVLTTGPPGKFPLASNCEQLNRDRVHAPQNPPI